MREMPRGGRLNHDPHEIVAAGYDRIAERYATHLAAVRTQDTYISSSRGCAPGCARAASCSARSAVATTPDEREGFFGVSMYWSHLDGDTRRHLLSEAAFALAQADVLEDQGEASFWVIATT
jgi:hypothetical protein